MPLLWHIRALYEICALGTLTLEIPQEVEFKTRWAMKLVHLCYAALGIAVARWIFKREPVALADPVTRLRSSGLL